MTFNPLALSSLILVSTTTHAVSFIDEIDGQLDMGEYLAENAYGFLPVPILITEPAVGYGGGFTGIFMHESDEQKNTRKQLAEKSIDGGAQLLTPAITAVGGFATENGTWMAFVGHKRSWKEDSIRYLGGLGYGDINMTFYRQSSSNALLPLDPNEGVELGLKGMGGIQKLQFRVPDSQWLLGFSQQFFAPTLSLNNHPKAQEILNNIGNTSPTSSGLGLIAEYDSKNSFLNPTQGYNYVAEYLWFGDAIGSDYTYQTFNVEGLNYWELNKEWNLALRGQYKSLSTNERVLSPQYYPDIELRGIARNRYQGEHTVAAEVQVSKQWTRRWSTAVFTGIGYAGSSNQDMFDQSSHAAYGVGFRYLIARRYGLISGIDIAFSEEDTALYFQVGAGI
ncbi:BamA/TamA family outer membrane protein [Vibrio sp. TMPB1044]|uniref:BamA/TamA family outer membrane protein n=1 Tax=Vibrio sp. TMPB1044 TaxID=3051822 RepID=UPI00255B7EEF|nr:BamA/TamA family outer membrane protein [Vibrio sp. TMPB1044]MDL5028234.1 BamA/TamA family outer membrane protein [Vibrio sp. TMPB1044]MDN5208362.1 BamA/TamA family outer membrane protein [Vibrio sp. TMPB1044]